jgi:hypothetical protein
LQPEKAVRGKRGPPPPLPAPTKESDVYLLGNLLKFFWGDTVQLRLLITRAQEHSPEDRCGIDAFRNEFLPFRDQELTQREPTKEVEPP